MRTKIFLPLVLSLNIFSISVVQAQQKSGILHRMHERLNQRSSLYHYLYKEFWAVDTVHSQSVRAKRPTLFALPYFSYAPETRAQFGAGGIFSFYTHPSDSITRISAQSATLSYTLNNQYKAEIYPDVWTAYNKTHYSGRLVFKRFPLNFYGIGYDTRNADQLLLDSRQLLVDIDIEKQVAGSFRLGAGLMFSSFDFELPANQAFFARYSSLYGLNGGQTLFAGVSFIYDTRDFLNYTTDGSYFRLAPSVSVPGVSTLNPLAQVSLKAVHYFKISPQFTLGLNGVSSTIVGEQVPFFLLAPLGGSNIERGYYLGRFRDKSLAAIQGEMKYRFIPRLALAAFAGVGTTWGNRPFSLEELKPSYGAGLHYFFSLPNRLTLRLDYGLGQKLPNEPRARGVYFSFSEAF